jgi:uncharacterized protein
MHSIIENNMDAIRDICEDFHIKSMYVFGSVSSDSFSENSDIDLLYEFDYGEFDPLIHPIEDIPFDPFIVFIELKTALENLFKRDVDLIPFQKFKNPVLNAMVEKTKKLIYAQKRYKEVFV